MALEISHIEPAPPQAWDGAWSVCDYATYFHSRQWADVWQTYTRGRIKPAPLRVGFSDGKTAILPLSCRTVVRGRVKVFESSPGGTFGGWISGDDLELEHARLLSQYLGHQLGNLTWRANPIDPLVAAAMTTPGEPDETHLIDLSPGFEAVVKQWSKGHKAAFKQAQRSGIAVRRARSAEDWRAYYRAYEDSVSRWGDKARVTYGWELFDALSACDSDRVTLWLALHNDDVVAGALCLYARAHVDYWHGAALRDYFERRPANLIMHAAIGDACERGYRWFDFNPSGGQEGVRNFKKSFGAAEVPAPVVTTQSMVLRFVRMIRRRQWAAAA